MKDTGRLPRLLCCDGGVELGSVAKRGSAQNIISRNLALRLFLKHGMPLGKRAWCHRLRGTTSSQA
jgi:hypothetical protein